MTDIIIIVKGGCAEPECVPAGIRIRIKNYDVDGVPDCDLSTDEGIGEKCILTVWE